MKKVLLLYAAAVWLTSCVKEERLEPAVPVNRYFKVAEIFALPQLNYDPNGSPPDLRVDLKRRSASFWEFSTYTENNTGALPAFMVFPAEVLATDEVWEIRVVDEDLDQLTDYEIFFWQFQAIEEGNSGEIAFYGDGKLIMVLNYNEK